MAGAAAGNADATATDVNERWYLRGRTQVERTQIQRAQARGEGSFAELAYRTQDDGSP